MVDADVKASREDLTAPDASETEAVRTTETETHTALPVDTERMIDHAEDPTVLVRSGEVKISASTSRTPAQAHADATTANNTT